MIFFIFYFYFWRFIISTSILKIYLSIILIFINYNYKIYWYNSKHIIFSPSHFTSLIEMIIVAKNKSIYSSVFMLINLVSLNKICFNIPWAML